MQSAANSGTVYAPADLLLRPVPRQSNTMVLKRCDRNGTTATFQVSDGHHEAGTSNTGSPLPRTS